ncbi:MAG: acylphosphatase [Deferribacterales bacterium]
MRRLHAVVHGRVQGVGYRASVNSRISKLDVTGYVKNLPDGTVEIVAEGADSVLADVLLIAEEGSLYSSVKKIDTTYCLAEGTYGGFSIAH